ncbi:hypothetical protein GCM10009827_109520 [Dactylosporangium maewongense]|uniref:Tyr recombinase domain-containing protein n=1 Tax=Dactylosporangium maewongense TaxID=634393 RepID=A0ABN2D4Y8_9ACTN
MTSRFNRLAVEAGVRAIGPHQARHLFASSLLDSGYGIPEVAERLGHDPGTLMRYYALVNAARRRQTADHIVELVAPEEAGQFLDPAGDLLTAGTDTLDAEHLSSSGQYGRHRGWPG